MPWSDPLPKQVQVVGILLFAFSRVQVDDPQLLDFLANIIQEIPPAAFTPQVFNPKPQTLNPKP